MGRLGGWQRIRPCWTYGRKVIFLSYWSCFRHFSDCETDHTKSDGKRPALKTPGICRAFGDTSAVRSQRCKNAGASLLSYKLWSLAHYCVPNSQPGAGALCHGRPPETSVCLWSKLGVQSGDRALSGVPPTLRDRHHSARTHVGVAWKRWTLRAGWRRDTCSCHNAGRSRWRREAWSGCAPFAPSGPRLCRCSACGRPGSEVGPGREGPGPWRRAQRRVHSRPHPSSPGLAARGDACFGFQLQHPEALPPPRAPSPCPQGAPAPVLLSPRTHVRLPVLPALQPAGPPLAPGRSSQSVVLVPLEVRGWHRHGLAA